MLINCKNISYYKIYTVMYVFPHRATNPQIVAYLQTEGGLPAAEAKSNAANYINKAIGYYFKR